MKGFSQRHPVERPPVVVITGASAGIGRATARAYAAEGAHIALLARGEASLEATRLEVEHAGGRALTIQVDVADQQAVEAAAEQIERELGPIDIWINNAFAGIFSEFTDMTADEFRRVTDVSYLGQVWGTKAALERMVPRNCGTIVLVGSALAYRGIPLQSAYCGAKHALQGFLDSVRAELLHHKSKVHLTMVQLSGVNTPQFDWVRARVRGKPRPTGAVYQPEVAARAIRFAASRRRKEVYVGAPAVQAILGDKIASALLDRYLGRWGVQGQQANEPVSADRRDNLFQPVPGDRGAHGRFDAQSRRSSVQLWATMNRNMLAIAGGVTAVGAFLFLRRDADTNGRGRKLGSKRSKAAPPAKNDSPEQAAVLKGHIT